jgi:hypothetical protein
MTVIRSMQIGRPDHENMNRLRVRREGGIGSKEENEGEKPFHGAEV